MATIRNFFLVERFTVTPLLVYSWYSPTDYNRIPVDDVKTAGSGYCDLTNRLHSWSR